jgi:hypothetical protein
MIHLGFTCAQAYSLVEIPGATGQLVCVLLPLPSQVVSTPNCLSKALTQTILFWELCPLLHLLATVISSLSYSLSFLLAKPADQCFFVLRDHFRYLILREFLVKCAGANRRVMLA